MNLNEENLLISSLERSIQFCEVDHSLKIGKLLFEKYNTNFYDILGKTIIENIGMGNISLIFNYLNFEQELNFDYFKKVIEETCFSNKDRSCSDSIYLASLSSIFSFARPIEESMCYFTINIDYLSKIKKLWLLLGKNKFDNKHLFFENITTKDNINEIIVFLENLFINKIYNTNNKEIKYLPEDNFHNEFNKIIKIVELGYKKQKINTFLSYPIIYQHFLFENKDIYINNSLNIEIDYVEYKNLGLKVPISCINQNTMEGNLILNNFLKSKNDFKDYLLDLNINDKYHFNILKNMLLRIELSEIKNQILFPTSNNIIYDCSNKILKNDANNNKNINYEELNKILKIELKNIRNFYN